jgi:hypothetical protein
MIAFAAFACFTSSCGPKSPGARDINERIPIQVRKIVTVEMRELSGAGGHPVGIHCSPYVWNALTNSQQSIIVQLKSADATYTEVLGVDPNFRRTTCDDIPDVHYFFSIVGKGKAVVEITFPNVPAEDSRADIIVCKSRYQYLP